ncbi:MAG: RHS repeat-associated core domain-containing protein, partial [Nitrospirota bacterium]
MLWYLRARNYDPRTGRFTARDRFAGYDDQPITLHRYIYAGNDPVL